MEIIIMSEKSAKFSKFLMIQVLIIGFIKMGETVFFFFEQNYLNLYLEQILGKEEIFITILVSTSAVAGLIFQFVWGVVSDNTRSKYGRRRPYFIFGGIISGVSMIVYAFSQDFWLCLVLDGFIIAVGTNAYLAAERSLIPDTFDKQIRGRANSFIGILGNIGLVLALALFLVSEMIFGYTPEGETGTFISPTGFIILLSVGGVFIILGGILGFRYVVETPTEELPPKKRFIQELKDTFNLKELKKQKEFGKILIALVIFRTGSSVIMPFLFSYILNLGMSTVELLIAIMGVSFPVLFLRSYLLGILSDKIGRKKFLPITIIITAIMISLIPFAGSPGNYVFWIILLCFPFVMMGLLGFAGVLDAWSQDLLPEEKRGQFNGILNITFTLSQVIGATVAGLIVDFDNDVTRSWIFPAAAFFYLLSIPFFAWVKDTLKPKEDSIES
ncbi:MAG: MFS transporter [Promethearchaeota archaeon]|nr:MAG: MFS transporter [Candidatus Lokiarchaeota archaeon]